jgi:hypothetical protein
MFIDIPILYIFSFSSGSYFEYDIFSKGLAVPIDCMPVVKQEIINLLNPYSIRKLFFGTYCVSM